MKHFKTTLQSGNGIVLTTFLVCADNKEEARELLLNDPDVQRTYTSRGKLNSDSPYRDAEIYEVEDLNKKGVHKLGHGYTESDYHSLED
jgi:hypothetical protein